MYLFSYFRRTKQTTTLNSTIKLNSPITLNSPIVLNSPINGIILDSSFMSSINENYTQLSTNDTDEQQINLTLPYKRKQSSPLSAADSFFSNQGFPLLVQESPRLKSDSLQPKSDSPVSIQGSFLDNKDTIQEKISEEYYFDIECAIKDVLDLFFGKNVDVKIY
jgi:hypothetical protein